MVNVPFDLRATPASRNRAVDAYRALAMVAVALGHWLAAAVSARPDGGLEGSNALADAPNAHWLTWLFQVMPLFFCLGGYSNAASLDAHRRQGGRDTDWVAARLRRLCEPTRWLALAWLAVLGLAVVTGTGVALAAAAAAIAAIPLWFLANYVVDTAVAPVTRRWHRRSPKGFIVALLSVFAIGEALRLAHVPILPQLNIVVGWMLFQTLGFWWRDGRLANRRAVLGVAAAAFACCVGLIALGPWPLAMVTVPGADFSNTWPPSAALVCFGLASCLLAVAAAPKVSQLLEGSHRAWSVVAGANAVTMTVYLWHFTAITVAAGAFHALGWLPTAPAGTATWWVQKLPLVAAAFVVLAGLVAVFGPRERAGLLSGSSEGGHLGTGPVVGVAVALAVGFECWTSAQGRLPLALGGIGLLLAARQVLVRPPRQAVQHGNPTPAKVDAKTNA